MTAVPLALVTGTPPHLGPAAAALGRAGFDVVAWQTPADAGACTAGPFDCYLQLPCGPMGPDGIGRGVAPELVCRIDGLAAVAGRLQPNASVLLGIDDDEPSGDLLPGDHPVSGNPVVAGEQPAGDLFAAVALALLEDLGRPAARIAVLSVADLCRPPEEGAAVVPAAVQWETPTPPRVSAP